MAKSSYDPGWMDMCIDMCRLLKKNNAPLMPAVFLARASASASTIFHSWTITLEARGTNATMVRIRDV